MDVGGVPFVDINFTVKRQTMTISLNIDIGHRGRPAMCALWLSAQSLEHMDKKACRSMVAASTDMALAH